MEKYWDLVQINRGRGMTRIKELFGLNWLVERQASQRKKQALIICASATVQTNCKTKW